MEQLGQMQWKYSDPTRRIRGNVVSAIWHELHFRALSRRCHLLFRSTTHDFSSPEPESEILVFRVRSYASEDEDLFI